MPLPQWTRWLGAGPAPTGLKLGLVVKINRSKPKPSSIIHTLMVCVPVVVTSRLAPGPSSVVEIQVGVGSATTRAERGLRYSVRVV